MIEMINSILLDTGIPELLLLAEFDGDYLLTIKRQNLILNAFKVPANITSLLINNEIDDYYNIITFDEVTFNLKEIKININKKSITLLLE